MDIVGGLHHIDAGPNLTFHFDAVADSDLTLHFDADPPRYESDGKLQLLADRSSNAPLSNFSASL